MTKIKFGLKLWSNQKDLLKAAIDLIENKVFDYIELSVVPNTNIGSFTCDLLYVIHAPHEKFGVNIGDPEKKGYNSNMINESIDWADKLNARNIILHSGYVSMNAAKRVLEEVDDKRILIENMPKVGLNDEKMIGYTPEQIKKLIDNKFGLCLDLNHAIKAAVSLGRPYKDLIEEFLKLKPKMFHISDGKLDNEKDEHLSIGEGDYDFEFLMNCIKENKLKYVTLETPRMKLNSLEEDLKNLEKLVRF